MEEDLQLLADIERQLAVYREDMERGFELRMAAVEKELADMEARGHRFFEDTLRIGRVVDLLNRARVQKEFEEKVVADAPIQIERRVTEMIDWLVDQDFRQWQAVTSKLSERHRQHASRMLGAPDVGTLSQRPQPVDRLGRTRSATRRGYLRQAPRGRGHRRPGARRRGGGRRRGRRRGRPRHAGDDRRVDGRRRRDGYPAGQRRARRRVS